MRNGFNSLYIGRLTSSSTSSFHFCVSDYLTFLFMSYFVSLYNYVNLTFTFFFTYFSTLSVICTYFVFLFSIQVYVANYFFVIVTHSSLSPITDFKYQIFPLLFLILYLTTPLHLSAYIFGHNLVFLINVYKHCFVLFVAFLCHPLPGLKCLFHITLRQSKIFAVCFSYHWFVTTFIDYCP